MDLTVAPMLTALTLFRVSDLKYRTAPAVETFFLASILLAAREEPFHAALVTLAVVVVSIVRWSWSRYLGFALIFYPPAWPVLLFGYGVGMNLIGKADLYAIGGVACLFPWPAVAATLLGVVVWTKWWAARGKPGPTPLIPGILLGLLVYILLHLLLSGRFS